MSRTATGVVLGLLCLGPAAFVQALGSGKVALRVIYTANLRGTLEPCGCQALQPGGLSRRGALIPSLRRQGVPTILLDAGDNLPGVRGRPEVLTFVYGVLETLRYDAVNIGPFDHVIPGDRLKQIAETTKLPLVCASSKSVPQPAPPMRLITAGKKTIAVIGAAHPGAASRIPLDALVRTAVRAARSAGVVIVLSQLPPAEAEELARKAPVVDLIISGRHDADLTPVRRVGATFIVPCSFFGQSVGVADLHLGGDGRVLDVKLTSHRLEAGKARDPSIEASVQQFYKQFNTVSPHLPSVAETDRVLSGVLGDRANARVGCEGCHKQAFSAWQRTRHAHAWQTLVQKGAAGRSDCISCHTTNQLSLTSLSPAITPVGCASCHGADPDHARNPGDPRFIVRRPAETVCRQCHTAQQSPNFSYATLLPHVTCLGSKR
jgi:hypothetical protein